jgi:hypothetical protein
MEFSRIVSRYIADSKREKLLRIGSLEKVLWRTWTGLRTLQELIVYIGKFINR